MSASTSHLLHAGSTPFLPVLQPLWSRMAEPFHFADEGVVICGSGDGCGIRIRLDGIAAEHARLEYRNGVLAVLRCSGSVWINDIPVNRTSILEKGDILSIGAASFRVDETVPAERRLQERRQHHSPAATGLAFSSGSNAWHPFAVQSDVPQRQPASADSGQPPRLSSPAAEPVIPQAAVAAPEVTNVPSVRTETTMASEPSVSLSELQETLDRLESALTLKQAELLLAQSEVSDRDSELIQLKSRLELLQNELVVQHDQFQSTLNTTIAGLREEAAQEKSRSAEELQNRLHELEERDRALAARERQFGDLENHWGELEQMRMELAQGVSATDTLRQQLEERASSLDAREQCCCDNAERITAWEAKVTAAQSELETRIRTIDEREAALAARIQEHSDRESHADQQLANLGSREDGLQLRQILLDEREAELIAEQCLIQERNEFLTQREAEIAATAQSLSADEDRLAAERQQLQVAQTACEHRQEALSLLQQQLSDLNNELIQNQARFREDIELQNQRDNGLCARENALDAAEAQLSERSESLEMLHRSLAEREASLNADRESLRELKGLLDSQIPDLTQQERHLQADHESLRDLELQLAKLEAARLDREDALNARENSIEETERSLASRSEQLTRMAAELDSRQDEIKQIRQELTNERLRLEQQAETIRETERRQLQRDAEYATELSTLETAHSDISRTLAALDTRQQQLESRAAELRTQEENLAVQQEQCEVFARTLSGQSAELQQQMAAFQELAADCRDRNDELERRSEELTHRLADFKRQRVSAVREADLERAHAVALSALEARIAELTADRTQLEQQLTMLSARLDEKVSQQTVHDAIEADVASLRLQLEESRVENQTLSDERHTLVSALRELQASFQQINQDITETEQTREQLQLTLDIQNVRLEALESELKQRDIRVSELMETLQTVQNSTAAETPAEPQIADQSEVVIQLELRLAEQTANIQQLQEQIAVLKSAAEAQHKLADDAENLAIRERELDRRADLLDRRDLEVSERSARLENSQAELQSQHRMMLEARQQLEQARAEIQLAMQQNNQNALHYNSGSAAQELPYGEVPQNSHEADQINEVDKAHQAGQASYTEASSLADSHWSSRLTRADSDKNTSESREYDAGHSYPDNGFIPQDHRTPSSVFHSDDSGMPSAPLFSDTGSDRPSATAEEVTQLRSELANLFGLKGKKAPAVEQNDIFLDTSLPTSNSDHAGVELKFSSNNAMLLTPPAPEPETTKASEDDSPDFVTDYMEQLLARSRKVAGGVLPNELQNKQNKQSSIAPPAKSRPQVTSFLDQYMSGAMGSLDSADSSGGAATMTPAAPRPKIDREVLRASMDSFRSVSTMSVENALATSAMQKERHFIIGRIAFVTLLGVLSIAQIVATAMGVYSEPMVLWSTIAATLVVGMELARKLTGIRGRIRGVLAGAGKRTGKDTKEAETLSEPVSPKPEDSPKSDPVVRTNTHNQPAEAELPDDDSRYFEL